MKLDNKSKNIYTNSDLDLFQKLTDFNAFNENKKSENSKLASSLTNNSETQESQKIYTDNDEQVFENLMTFAERRHENISRSKVIKNIETKKRTKKINISAQNNYTEVDIEQFKKLMSFGYGNKKKENKSKDFYHKQKSKIVAKNVIKPERASYTNDDIDLFEKLMGFDGKSALSGHSDSLIGKNIKQGGASSYTLSDSKVFEKYMAFSGEAPDWISRIGSKIDRSHRGRKKIISKLATVTEEDINYIKIVDFDKEKEKERKNRKTGRKKVKVLYFK